MKKKEFLTEAKRKAIIADKEKAIIESFAKTFNKIKRIDENVINEVDSFEIASKNVSEVVRENDGPNAKYLTIKFNDGSEMYMYQNMRLGKRFALPKEFESKNYEAAYLNYILENSGHRFWEIYEFFNNMAIDGDSEESLNEFENETPKKFKPMDIVIWSPKKTRWNNEYGVRYGAKAKVIQVLGDMLKIEWLKDPSNLKLVGGQMDGNYFTDDFEFADVNQNDHEDWELANREQQYRINPYKLEENDIEYDQAADEQKIYLAIKDLLTTTDNEWDDMDTVLSVGEPRYSTFYCSFPLLFEYGERPNDLSELEEILKDKLGPMLYSKIEGRIEWNKRSDINHKPDVIATLSYGL